MTKEHESEPLTLDQRALAEYMSELSEEAYFAGWMTDLEYNLWEAVLGIRRRYGLITISQAKVQKLKALADACSGWIVFEDHLGETWLPTDVWVERFATWQKKGSESREI